MTNCLLTGRLQVRILFEEPAPDTITKDVDVIEPMPDTITKGEDVIEPNTEGPASGEGSPGEK